jgi:hypothetical protein
MHANVLDYKYIAGKVATYILVLFVVAAAP